MQVRQVWTSRGRSVARARVPGPEPEQPLWVWGVAHPQGGETVLSTPVCASLCQAVTPCLSDRQDCVEQLLKNMFDGDQTESCLVSGTQVLLTLLETGRAG